MAAFAIGSGVLAAVCLGAAHVGTSARDVVPPNVVLVTIDTLRADRVGAYGATRPATPTLDGLARAGTLFEHVTVDAPLTRPSHVSILTGKHPFQHGIRDNFSLPLAPEHRTLAEVLKAHRYVTGAFIGSFILNAQSGLDHGFDHFDEEFEPGSKRSQFFSDYRRSADKVEQQAGAWIERQAAGPAPFFAWVHFYDVHSPYMAPPPFSTRYGTGSYEASVAFTDQALGHLLARLERAKVADRTLVVVTSDHGEGLGEHNEDEHGFFVYESTLRVPLIIRFPGRLPAGLQVRALARSVDVFATILDLVGLSGAAPAGLPSRSLAPNIRNPSQDALRAIAYGETLFPLLHFGWSDLRTVRQGDWKYIEAPRPELYDLAHDPGERTNLFAREGQRARSLRSRLLDTLGTSPERELVATSAPPADPATLERLASLGYVSGPGGQADHADPKDKIGEFEGYTRGLRLALQAYDKGDLPSAIERLRAIIAAGRGGFDVSYYLGRAYIRSSRFKEAIEPLREAIVKVPTYTPAYLELAKAYVALERYDEANGTLLDGLHRDPGNFQFDAHLGYLARLRHDLPTARQYYEKARALKADDFDVRMNLSTIYRNMGDARAALAEADAALRLQPDAGLAHNERGMLLAATGDLAGATKAFARAAALEPQNPGVWFNLGLARKQTGDKPGAADAFRRALALKPDFDEARKLLADVSRN